MNPSLTKKWFQYRVPRASAAVRVFCFPYAGGSATIYRQWVRRAPSFIEVLPVQLPGRFTRLREAPFTSMQPLVQQLADELASELTRPFAFFGHSMGAHIAFELTRELAQRERRLPSRLFVSARRAPQLPDTRPPTYDLPEQQFLDEVTKLKGTPLEILQHPDLLALVMPVLRADMQICETYRFAEGPPISTPITAFAGLQDERCPSSVVEPWREQTLGGFQLFECEGDHFFIHEYEEFVVRKVIEVLSKDLSASSSSGIGLSSA